MEHSVVVLKVPLTLTYTNPSCQRLVVYVYSSVLSLHTSAFYQKRQY